MANTLRRLYGPAAMPTVATAIITVPASTKYLIKYIVMANTSAVDRTVSLWINGTADGNAWVDGSLIVADGRYEFDGNAVLQAADVLNAISDSATVTITIFGVEET